MLLKTQRVCRGTRPRRTSQRNLPIFWTGCWLRSCFNIGKNYAKEISVHIAFDLDLVLGRRIGGTGAYAGDEAGSLAQVRQQRVRLFRQVPDPYRRIADPGFCEGNSYRRYLLCLARRDDPDSKFFVTLVIEGPFAIKTTRGDNEYTPQKIGQHLFYCGLGGSMAVGFSDECTFDLNDKTLEFNVSPAQPTDPTGKINPLMFETLKTFRVL